MRLYDRQIQRCCKEPVPYGPEGEIGMHANVQESANGPSKTLDLRKFSFLIVYMVFFAVLNETVFNVSTPAIAEQFSLTPSAVSWVITSFIIMFGLGQVVFGKLADMYELRKLIVIGILFYVGASMLGLVLQAWYPLIIVSRALQGAGCAALPALAMVIVARYFTPEQRGKLFGLFTSAASTAVAVGPVIGGFVTARTHWSFLFLIPLFTLATIPAFLRLLPHEGNKNANARVDVIGAILLGVSIASFVVFCTNMEWFYFVVSAAAGILFALQIRRSSHPFIDPALFSRKMFRNGVIIGFVLFGALFGIIFLVPFMFKQLHGLSTDQIGLTMFPGAVAAAIFGVIAGQLTARKGSHFVVYVGIICIIASLLLIAGVTDKWVWFTGGVLILMYIGQSLMQTAMAETITRTLPMEQIGVGMGLYGLSAFVSGAVGTAVVGALVVGDAFNFRLLPFVYAADAHKYSNLLLLFAALIAISGLLYVIKLGSVQQEPQQDSSVATE